MTTLAWMIIAIGSGYFIGERKYLHCVVFVAAIILARGAITETDALDFRHEARAIQRQIVDRDPMSGSYTKLAILHHEANLEDLLRRIRSKRIATTPLPVVKSTEEGFVPLDRRVSLVDDTLDSNL